MTAEDNHREAWEALKASQDFKDMEANEAQVLRDLAVEQAMNLIPGPWEESTVDVDGVPFPIAVRKVPEEEPDLLAGGFDIDG